MPEPITQEMNALHAHIASITADLVAANKLLAMEHEHTSAGFDRIYEALGIVGTERRWKHAIMRVARLVAERDAMRAVVEAAEKLFIGDPNDNRISVVDHHGNVVDAIENELAEALEACRKAKGAK